MHTHIEHVLAFVIGWLAAIISFVFDVPAPTMLAAFIGSCFAVAFTEPVTYKKAAWMIFGGTVAAGLLLPVLTHHLNLGDYPQRGLSAGLAFVLIVFRRRLFRALSARVGKLEDPS